MTHDDLNEGDVYDITLNDGTSLSGYTLYEIGEGTITVGYDGEQDDGGVEGIGLKRVIRLADLEDISPV